MKKQILIISILGIVMIGFLLITLNSNSQNGILFESSYVEVDSAYPGENPQNNGIEGGDEDVEPKIPKDYAKEMVYVDIGGEVINPGVFKVGADARIGHVIDLAGGLTEYANTRGINQALRVHDELSIWVPHIDDEIILNTSSGSTAINNSTPVDDGLISINNASSVQLQTLSGIGPALADNIIAYREEFGPFTSIDELLNVNRIGERLLEGIRAFIKL